ncbi:MAG TPA: hypothetical protein VK525_03855 [Candidatus Saccharimonadales bacterium]|nr:hypothetical protein [Candidatus Saccharimonadales bacterium]
MSLSSRRSPVEVLAAIRSLLSSQGLSLAELTRRSRVRFPSNSLFWIPSNFYNTLHHLSFTPSLHQLFALSVLTGYRLTDWLAVFGFSFDAAASFQASWPRFQTVELDARIYDRHADVSWFEEAHLISLGNELLPLSHWLSGEKTIRRLDSLAGETSPTFRYLKIGTGDAYAYPDLLPESVVRVDPRAATERLLSEPYANRILAIEHARGITCSRVRPSGHDRVMLCSRQVPYAPVELKLETEARVLGVVDLEFRRLVYRGAPTVTSKTARHWTPSALPQAAQRISVYLRRSRLRAGLSFREASDRTREIARVLEDSNYFCAASALSDMEAREVFPRHVHKLISLSAVYCLSAAELVALAGLSLGSAGQEAMPKESIKITGRRSAGTEQLPSQFLQAIADSFEEIPFFLQGALPTVLGLSSPSVRDLFWAGTTSHFTHPYLKNCAFLAVNRKSKTPAPALSSPVWAQPLFVLELRNGNRFAAACTLQNGTLHVRPCTTAARTLIRLRNHVDVEILGKIVSLVRRLAN